MIHILGHNDIVRNLSKVLKDKGIEFKVFSNVSNPKDIYNYYFIDNVNELKKALQQDGSKCLRISAGAPWMFSKSFLEEFEEGIFNVHGTALPQDRGGTVVSWLILNKKRLGYSVIHKMTSSPDAGPILMVNEFIYPLDCIYPYQYLEIYNIEQEKLATKLCLEWADKKVDLRNLSIQPHYLSTYWPRLQADLNAAIDWSLEGQDIELFVRAFDDPYNGAFTFWRNLQIRIKKGFFQSDLNFHPFQWGIVYRKTQTPTIKYLAISVKNGTLYIQDVVDNEGNDIFDKISEGDRFYTEEAEITKSKQRVIKAKGGFNTQTKF